MIDKKKLETVTTIVTHDNCSDGLAAAMLLRDVYPNAEIIFCQHNTPAYENLEVRPNMLFADIIPPPKRYQEFLEAGALVLDHHKGVREIIEAFGENSVFGDEKAHPGVSGATLVYLHVWAPMRRSLSKSFVETFARRAGIRDTWQKQDPEWYNACLQGEVLYFYPREMWLTTPISEVASRWDGEFQPVGDILMKKQAESIARVAKECYHFTTKKGTRVVAVNHLRMSSDLAEHFDKNADLVVSFSYKVEPTTLKAKFICSSRSHTGYDCISLAQRFGGGGHTAAAGFSVLVEPEHPNAFEMIKNMVELHEAQ